MIDTRKTRVLYIIFSALGALFLVLLLLFTNKNNEKITQNQTDSIEGSIKYKGIVIPVSLADTEEERSKGLSGTRYLTQGFGKLFIFENPLKPGFWMKDMNYPIDIVWIDKDFKIVGIEKSVSPETYPEIFYPQQDVLYVLEINADFSSKIGLTENQILEFSKNLSF